MKSRQDNHSSLVWKDFPVEAGWLSEWRLVAPIQPAIYGEPGPQVILSGNHQLSLDHTAEHRSNLTLIVLDSGGFSTEVAVLLGQFPPPHEHAFTNYVESVDGRVTYLIPQCLLTAWGWRDGESHLGGIVYVDMDAAASVLTRIAPSFLIRLCVIFLLAAAQSFLFFVGMALFGMLSAFFSTLLLLFGGVLLLSLFWNILPGGPIIKSGVVGIIFSSILGILGAFHIFYLPFYGVGVLALFLWLGVSLQGARW